MAPAESPTKCVLLAALGQRDEAYGQLDRRGWTAEVAEAPLRALAELCLLERSRDSRRAWGHSDQEGLALVVVDPPRWAQLSRLLSAARRYVPSASLWGWEQGTMKPLSENPAAQPPEAPSAAPAPFDDALLPPPISRQEIAMLLEGDLQEGAP